MTYKKVFQLAQDKGYKFNGVDVMTILLRLKIISLKQRKRETYLYLCEIQKWLRDEHEIRLKEGQPAAENKTIFTLYKKHHKLTSITASGNTYEEALLQGIAEALNLLP